MTVNLGLCLLQEGNNNKGPSCTISLLKPWFLCVRKISGNQVFLFLLTISDSVDVLDNHRNSFPDSTGIEFGGKWKVS